MVKKSIADFVYDILEENHRPMHYRRITEEVIKVKKMNAENPHHDVNAIMGSDQRFIKYQRGIWGLVKWKYREAHLPYSLTSYCLRNGTIFLTSYLIPYFNWAHDDRNAEVIFIDIEGEEIKATVNYRQKLISGFQEWFQRRELDVNDTLLIGLIDEEKRKYFIIPEKETQLDIEKDMSEIIFQVIREAGRPLYFAKIYENITNQNLDQVELSGEYIKNILKNDHRFLEIHKERWGLLEWFNEMDHFSFNLSVSNKFVDFLTSLKECFDFLGYQTEWFGNFEKELLVARAILNYKSYSMLITGLPKDYDINTVQAIHWADMGTAKEKANADSVILFAEKFIIRELVDRANEEGVQLYPTLFLEDIMKEHRRIPFSLFDLRIAFSPMHHPKNNVDKLMEIRNNQWGNWNLIRDIFSILQSGNETKTAMDIDWLLSELNHHSRIFRNGNIDQIEVKKVIEPFIHEPLKMIEISETGSMILSFSSSIAQKRIQLLTRLIMEGEEK